MAIEMTSLLELMFTVGTCCCRFTMFPLMTNQVVGSREHGFAFVTLVFHVASSMVGVERITNRYLNE